MKVNSPRKDFIIVEDYFTAEQAAEWLDLITRLGEDPLPSGSSSQSLS